MVRVIAAVVVLPLCLCSSVSASATDKEGQRAQKIADALATSAVGAYVRMKLRNGRKLEGVVVDKKADSLAIEPHARVPTMIERIRMSDLTDVRLGYGFGTRVKARLSDVALTVMLVCILRIAALIRKPIDITGWDS